MDHLNDGPIPNARIIPPQRELIDEVRELRDENARLQKHEKRALIFIDALDRIEKVKSPLHDDIEDLKWYVAEIHMIMWALREAAGIPHPWVRGKDEHPFSPPRTGEEQMGSFCVGEEVVIDGVKGVVKGADLSTGEILLGAPFDEPFLLPIDGNGGVENV